METNLPDEIEGYILELYRHGTDMPCYISSFDSRAVAGFDGYSPKKEEAVVFESREALLPLAAIEVEVIEPGEAPGSEEISLFDGFRIWPFKGKTVAQLVSNEELEAALEEFDR